jgi:hypothetical protein
LKILFASLKTLPDFENSSESLIKFLFRLSFALIGQFFSSVHSKPAFGTISGPKACYGTTFRDTGGYQKAGTSSLNEFHN